MLVDILGMSRCDGSGVWGLLDLLIVGGCGDLAYTCDPFDEELLPLIVTY